NSSRRQRFENDLPISSNGFMIRPLSFHGGQPTPTDATTATCLLTQHGPPPWTPEQWIHHEAQNLTPQRTYNDSSTVQPLDSGSKEESRIASCKPNFSNDLRRTIHCPGRTKLDHWTASVAFCFPGRITVDFQPRG